MAYTRSSRDWQTPDGRSLSELGEGESEHLACRLWAFIQRAPVAAVVKDGNGRYLYGNALFEEIARRQDWRGRTAAELFSPELAKRLASVCEQARRTGESVSILIPCELEEGTRWWKAICFPVDCPDEEDELMGMIAVDVTDQRRIEGQVMDVSDREQRRFGRDLHDGLCQHLVGVRMMSQILLNALEREGSPHAAKALSITTFLQGMVDVSRELIQSYHPTGVEEGGLGRTLAEFAASAGRLFNVPVNVSVRDEVAIPRQDVAVQLFRIVQEAVFNAMKHAGASRVDVLVDTRKGAMVVEVRDDGRGLPPEDDRKSDGLGMTTMNYRAQAIGANLEILSDREDGVTVRCTIPVDRLCRPPRD